MRKIITPNEYKETFGKKETMAMLKEQKPACEECGRRLSWSPNGVIHTCKCQKTVIYRLVYNSQTRKHGEVFAESEAVSVADRIAVAQELIELVDKLPSDCIADCCDAAEYRHMFGDDLPIEANDNKWYTYVRLAGGIVSPWREHENELEAHTFIAVELENLSWLDWDLNKTIEA